MESTSQNQPVVHDKFLRIARKQRLQAMVRKRRDNLLYLSKMHSGGHYWLNRYAFPAHAHPSMNTSNLSVAIRTLICYGEIDPFQSNPIPSKALNSLRNSWTRRIQGPSCLLRAASISLVWDWASQSCSDVQGKALEEKEEGQLSHEAWASYCTSMTI